MTSHIIFVNIYSQTKNAERVVVWPFDAKNPEHLFVLHVAKGVAGVYGKEIYVDTSYFQLHKLNKGLNKDCRFKKLKGMPLEYCVDPISLLFDLKKYAFQHYNLSDDFNFGEIYHAFYAKKGKQ